MHNKYIIHFPTADLCGCSGRKSGPASAELTRLSQAIDGAVHVQCVYEARPMENVEKEGLPKLRHLTVK